MVKKKHFCLTQVAMMKSDKKSKCMFTYTGWHTLSISFTANVCDSVVQIRLCDAKICISRSPGQSLPKIYQIITLKASTFTIYSNLVLNRIFKGSFRLIFQKWFFLNWLWIQDKIQIFSLMSRGFKSRIYKQIIITIMSTKGFTVILKPKMTFNIFNPFVFLIFISLSTRQVS